VTVHGNECLLAGVKEIQYGHAATSQIDAKRNLERRGSALRWAHGNDWQYLGKPALQTRECEACRRSLRQEQLDLFEEPRGGGFVGSEQMISTLQGNKARPRDCRRKLTPCLERDLKITARM
jgi:hypothetical protein